MTSELVFRTDAEVASFASSISLSTSRRETEKEKPKELRPQPIEHFREGRKEMMLQPHLQGRFRESGQEILVVTVPSKQLPHSIAGLTGGDVEKCNSKGGYIAQLQVGTHSAFRALRFRSQ